MTDEKRPVDWAEIERDYRQGTMSVREIARWYGLSDKAIRNKAKAGSWERVESAGGPHVVRADPEPQMVYVGTVLTPENASPEAIIGRGRNLVLRMLDELDTSTTRIGELEAIIESAVDTADGGKQREALQQAVSLKQRSDVLRSLATAAKTFAETGSAVPAGGKKAERQAAGEAIGKGAGKFAAPPAPPLRVVN